jgi:hypothetical protein
MRLCIIGDSHVGALKQAIDVLNNSDIFSQVVFFAKGSDGMRNLVADKNTKKLMPGTRSLGRSFELTSQGLNHIDPIDYDCFLVYGLGYQPYFKHSPFVSEQLDQVHFEDTFNTKLLGSVVRKLREVTDKPIYIGHTPFRAVSTVKTTDVDGSYENNINLIDQYLKEHFNKVTLLPQPIESICDKRKTKPDFCKGSIRMETGHNLDGTVHPVDDLSHMNESFGRLWLQNFLDILAKM